MLALRNSNIIALLEMWPTSVEILIQAQFSCN